jgi:hypothetical protein
MENNKSKKMGGGGGGAGGGRLFFWCEQGGNMTHFWQFCFCSYAILIAVATFELQL